MLTLITNEEIKSQKLQKIEIIPCTYLLRLKSIKLDINNNKKGHWKVHRYMKIKQHDDQCIILKN